MISPFTNTSTDSELQHTSALFLLGNLVMCRHTIGNDSLAFSPPVILVIDVSCFASIRAVVMSRRKKKERDPVGDTAAKAGFINTDGLFVFPHRLVLHVPTQRFACQTLQMLNRFDNNGLRSHETRTEFLGNCANMFAKCPNNNAFTAFSASLFCLMLLHLPMLHFSAVI